MKTILIRTLSVVLYFTSSILFADPLKLSLNEAILLAARNNPNVQSSQLNLVLQKFNVHVEEWAFSPHYSLQASYQFVNTSNEYSSSSEKNLNVEPGVSLLTPLGTQAFLTFSNRKSKYYNPGLSLQVIQPLLKGFGPAVVDAALNNAKDSEVIARLNVEGLLRETTTNVINAYLDVIYANRIIEIDQDALTRAELSVKQTKLFIKAGHKAGNELITVEANVASANTQLENDKNNLTQAKYALLTAIGLDPNTEIKFSNLNLDALITKFNVPNLEVVKDLMLENDIQYQIDNITLHGSTSRSLLLAKDNARWQLNLTANIGTGNGVGGGVNAGVNSIWNGINRSQSVGLTLQIPIDDQLAKQGILNAKIALQQAEIALKQERWSKLTNAINGWNSVDSARRALFFAEHAEDLQVKTYQVSYQKYLHGLIDSLELQTAQVQLIQSQQISLNARIAYLKALANLDLIMGHTLKTWNLSVRI